MFWDDLRIVLRDNGLFRCLVEFFIEQDDKEGLQALSDIISQEIDRAPSTELALNHYGIVRICQRLGGGVHGPLRRLAERIGGAKVLRLLDFSRIRANDMREMLSILGIERDQMNAALSSISDRTAPRDELAAVLRRLEWARGPDRWSMIAATDFLARSFTWRWPGCRVRWRWRRCSR